MLSTARAEELLTRASKQRILVYGDLMLDRYVHGNVERISPEAPVPVVHVQKETGVAGGSCNVAMNIQKLGGQAVLAGVIGEDTHGEELCDVLRSENIDLAGVHRNPRTQTIVKTRIMADRQQICRVDWEDPDMEQLAEDREFREQVLAQNDACNALIIEDYGKGMVTPNIVRPLLDSAKARNIPSGFDPKDNHAIDCSGVTVATPNRKEAFQAANLSEPAANGEAISSEVKQAGAHLLSAWQPELLLMTLGPQGMALFEQNADPVHVPTRAKEVFDVSGAGDTVIATFILALSGGASFREAAELANTAAGIVVAKLGTATCSPEEILANLN